MVKMLQGKMWKNRSDVSTYFALTLLWFHWIFARNVARNQEKNWYILIPFDVSSFWHVLSLPSLPSETASTQIPRIASSDYVPQRMEDSQILVTKGSIVELRAVDVRSCANSQAVA